MCRAQQVCADTLALYISQYYGRETSPSLSSIFSTNTGSEGSIFTFMLSAVSRILWYMLEEQGKDISEGADKSFYHTWFQNIVLASTKIRRKKDG